MLAVPVHQNVHKQYGSNFSLELRNYLGSLCILGPSFYIKGETYILTFGFTKIHVDDYNLKVNNCSLNIVKRGQNSEF